MLLYNDVCQGKILINSIPDWSAALGPVFAPAHREGHRAGREMLLDHVPVVARLNARRPKSVTREMGLRAIAAAKATP